MRILNDLIADRRSDVSADACFIHIKKTAVRLCNFSGEKHEHHQGDFFGGVFC
jgi:hypothetical protein